MNAIMTNIADSLHIAWAIAWKDIVDALKNKATRINLILLVGLVVFFYWSLNIRPWDKQVNIVVYDEGHTSLAIEKTTLEDGSELVFHKATSLQEMESIMSYKNLGLVIPADFDRLLESGAEPTLNGYIFWSDRAKAAELETKYARQLTELLGQPVRVSIGKNILIPQNDDRGNASTAAFHMFFAVFYIAIAVAPHLMFEEKRAKTLDALLVSPASAGQVILGKALAGCFYMLLSGGLALILSRAYVTNWGLALLAFCCSALFSIGLALVLGSLVQSPQQLALWSQPVVFGLLVPAFFAQEPLLAANLKAVISWLPTTALVNIFGYSVSKGMTLAQLGTNLAIVLGYVVLVYAVVVWKLRRLDR